MLTPAQEKYMNEKFPADAMAQIKPWDPVAAAYAENLIDQLQSIMVRRSFGAVLWL